MVERDPYKPLYLVIAEDLRDKIERGELRPEARLPSEREICEQYECSSITARHAITELRNAGLVLTRKGKGAFVAPSPPPRVVRVAPDRFQRPHSRPTYQQEADRAAMELDIEHSTEHVDAPAEVAERLGIDEESPVTETTYKISMAGQPVSISVAWEPLALTGGTEIENPHDGPYGGKGIVPRFDAIGYHVDTEEEFLIARLPKAHEIEQLKVPPGTPVIEIWQTFWAGDVATEVAKIIFRADRYEFHYRLLIGATKEGASDGTED
ncbi:GntR family transcriptional regulator [Actinomadura meridiana]|uniref:GntR family transcriptional regulator n=1 Tax=Actinomadura meridiana TaxID=559626 RepID=A0ABP8C2L5_9ACTN